MGRRYAAGAVPAGTPELPADLKGDHGLTCACRHGQENAPLPLENGLHGAVDGDLLVIARALPRELREGGEQTLRGGLIRQPFSLAQPRPKFLRCRKPVQLSFKARKIVELDDACAIRGIGKLQAENVGIVPGLLQSVAGGFMLRFGFNHGNRKVSGIAQQIIGALLRTAFNSGASDHDTSISEGLLLGEGVRRDVPSSVKELGEHILSTGVSFRTHLAIPMPRALCHLLMVMLLSVSWLSRTSASFSYNECPVHDQAMVPLTARTDPVPIISLVVKTLHHLFH